MNIKERLTLLKAGYSKEEINAMIDDEKSSDQPAEQPAEDKTAADVTDFMSVVSALAEEVKGMKKAMQNENLKKTEIEGQKSMQDQVNDILQSIINPVEETTKE